MYQLKQIPEDFIVKEITNIEPKSSGLFVYLKLKKEHLNTLDAIKIIAKKLRIKEKDIGFAGSKDKNALTEQIISLYYSKKEEALRLAGVMLYWAEGCKGWSTVKFVNSDPSMIKLFLSFLREVCAAVRREVGPSYPVSIKLTAADNIPGGFTLEEAVTVARPAIELSIGIIARSALPSRTALKAASKETHGSVTSSG